MATDERAAIKALYERERGYWRPWNEVLLQQRPRFLQAYADYAGYPASQRVLSERMVELVYVALDASATHLFPSGLKLHMQKALACGASDADILDVLTLVSLQAVGAVANAIDAMLAVYGDTAEAAVTSDLQACAAALGLPAELLARLQPLDPPYFARLQALAESGFSATGLSAGERCLVSIALHACFTGSNATALRASLLRAKQLGVVQAEVLQVIQLGAHLAVHGTALGATTLAEIAGANHS